MRLKMLDLLQAIINGQPAYSPNPKNWGYRLGTHVDAGIENYTDSIYNAYVQNNQLTIVAMEDGYKSAMIYSLGRQKFTFGMFAAKIRLPYGQGIWPAWWMVGNADQYKLWGLTAGEIDTLEMVGGSTRYSLTDQFAHGTIHWNNQSNTMDPVEHGQISTFWETPDGSMLHNNSLVYWTEWNATTIRIGVNEFTYSQINTTNLPNSINPVWAFSGKWPFYLYLNIAIGGVWPLPPDNTTVWPQQMVVDWVRVFQKKKLTMDD